MDVFMQVIGYIGAIGIAFFSFPEIIRCFKNKNTVNVNVWLFGLLAVSSACFWITGFYNVSKDVEAGADFSFGLAVAIANVFSFLSPVIILFYKLVNVMKAKKHGMT
ncbi:MAG: hypothetical protein K2N92_02360, partial [Malacoplasma sp.]|nr:hypothetical protein [Malacoplasma sp.]